MSNQHPVPTPLPQQLSLPWFPPDPPPEPLPDPPRLQPQQIWISLSPALQTQVRSTILHVLREVFDERSCS